jgi:uncharacterized protein (TIGR02246 family)
MRSSLVAARDIVLTALVGVLVIMGAARQAATAERESSSVRLQRLEDREAIRRLIMEYGRALDQRDWPAFANLFAKNDGEWVGGMGAAKGRPVIQKLMEDTIGPSSRTNEATGTRGSSVHVFTNETINVRGDTATGLTKWLFVGSTSDNRPQPLLLGHYVDTFVRENGEWKFKRRLAYGDIPANEPKASN